MWLEDTTATGTIENWDAIPHAWLARFGRTAAEQALDAVRGRLSAERTPGFRGRFAGHALPEPNVRPRTGREADAEGTETGDGADGGSLAFRTLPHDGGEGGHGRETRTLTAEDILLGTSFASFSESGAGHSTGFWGGATRSGFGGRYGDISVDGQMTSVRLGADRKRKDTLYGLMLFSGRGEGTYRGPTGSGAVEADLSGLVPYASRESAQGLSFWGAAGLGRGEMTLTPEGQSPLVADLGWSMLATGAEGTPAGLGTLGGAEVGWNADALWTRTTSDATAGLVASESETTRLRISLRIAWERTLASGGTLHPELEAGLRHDGGDAETGFGLEVGGGVRFADSGSGLSASMKGRTLAVHDDGDFKNWSLSLDVAWDPRPETKRGTLVLATRDWGDASDGVDALLGPEAFPGLTEAGGQGDWAVEFAHGTGRGQGMVGSRYVRTSGAGEDGEMRLGYRIEPDAAHAAAASVDLWAGAGVNGGGQGAGATLQWRW